MNRIEVAIGIVIRDGKILICQRRPQDRLGGFWELPGGKRLPHETLHQCLARELAEELALTARPVEALPAIDYDYPDISVRLHPFVCQHEQGEPLPLGCAQTRWVSPSELLAYRFPPANENLIRLLAQRGGM